MSLIAFTLVPVELTTMLDDCLLGPLSVCSQWQNSVLFFFFFWPHHTTCGILNPLPGIKPAFPAVEALSLNSVLTESSSRGKFWTSSSCQDIALLEASPMEQQKSPEWHTPSFANSLFPKTHRQCRERRSKDVYLASASNLTWSYFLFSTP